MTTNQRVGSSSFILFILIVGLPQLRSMTALQDRAYAGVEIPKVSIDAVESLLTDPSVRIFDAKSRQNYEKNHVPGAVNLAFDALSEKSLPANKQTTVIFYCMNEMCSASVEAACKASSLGYSKVMHMASGIQGWIKAGKPVERVGHGS
jgi:rhodanese-related sulfurtransferase